LLLLSLPGPLLLRLLLLRLLSPLLLWLLSLRLLGPLLRLLLLRLLGRLLLLRSLLLRLLLRLLGPLLLWLLLLRLLGPLLLLRSLLLRLLGPLLLWLLSGLSVLLLLRLPLRLLSACLRLLRLFLPRFRFALFFLLLVVLRVRRDNRPEKQKQGSATGSSNELHSNRPPVSFTIGHARRRPVRLNDVPLPLVPRPRPWSCASSHPDGWVESRAYTVLMAPSSTY